MSIFTAWYLHAVNIILWTISWDMADLILGYLIVIN